MTRISYMDRLHRAPRGQFDGIIQEALTDCADHISAMLRTYHAQDMAFVIASMEMAAAALRNQMHPCEQAFADMIKTNMATVIMKK